MSPDIPVDQTSPAFVTVSASTLGLASLPAPTKIVSAKGYDMKRMTTGALVAVLGTALLVGGGGTLAVWNAEQTTDAGTIVAGELDLKAVAGTTTWETSVPGAGPITNIDDYRVVPGETLTFTQKLDLHLEGDNLSAMLTATGGTNDSTNPFLGKNITVSDVTVTDAEGTDLTDRTLDEHDSGIVTAAITFTFKSGTDSRESVNARYDFGNVRYVLTQQPLSKRATATE